MNKDLHSVTIDQCRTAILDELAKGANGHFTYMIGYGSEKDYERPLKVSLHCGADIWVRLHLNKKLESGACEWLYFTPYRSKAGAEMGYGFQIANGFYVCVKKEGAA